MSKKLNLSLLLIESRFFFLPNGKHSLQTIFNYVQASMPHLCNDEIMCNHKGEDYKAPEWKHQVRTALGALQKKGVVCKKGKMHGFWIKK